MKPKPKKDFPVNLLSKPGFIDKIVQKKDDNEALLMSYLNLMNPREESLRFDIVDLEIRDSKGMRTVKSAMNSLKKKGGFLKDLKQIEFL